MATRISTQKPTSSAAATQRTGDASVSKDSRFSNDFKQWLQTHGYGKYAFAQGNVPAFGGKRTPGEKVTKEPVIFIHGNSDSAAGWKGSIETFSKNGYKPSELYAMTWGPANPLQAANQHHSQEYLEEVRAFIQAVKEYTGAKKVDVIGHSMGVTLARKAIQGGDGFDPYAHSKFNLGKPLTDSVDTFVGIAGANHGLAAALWTGDMVPTTNRTSGLHPDSAILKDLNAVNHDEGEHVYSIWSNVDEVVGVGLAGFTSPIPGQDGAKVYNTFPYGHMGLKNLTGEEQLAMVRDHQVR
ncbi:alpha/beta hydrolase [Pyxidicoccus parkwayensis]|uniref:Alpha/beta hydrolase n=1 Tax=Pyxidicoccus parkwayensis TaxID=2813578 RepID=A0ABX7P9S5_9BACT|nr:lipase family protein [Pyxidicoccus parkwaysis]QSQ27263.1 alpha/beta hydrolase [Pyxidicoccus parkwaysis]